MATVPINNPSELTPKKSKTQKVLAVATRPLRTVGRIVGKGKRHRNHHDYGSIFGDEDADLIDEEMVDDSQLLGNSSQGCSVADVADVATPQRQGSFMERVSSYRNSAANVSGDESSMSRRGTALGGVPVDPRDWVVFKAERILRTAGLVSIAFIIGSYRAEWRGLVQRMFEYVAVAWLTCCALWIMSATAEPPATVVTRSRRIPFGRRARKPVREVVEEDEHPNRSSIENEASNDQVNDSTSRELQRKSVSDDELAELIPAKMEEVPSEQAKKEEESSITTPAKQKQKSSKISKKVESISEGDEENGKAKQKFTNTHPSLDAYYCIDTMTGARVGPNSAKSYVLNNDWFEGTMMVMIRTPDMDDITCPKGNADNELVKSYFKDKQRRFEFQYQIKLKKLPEGQKIYFAAELDEPVKMGMIQRAFVGAAMAFIKSTNNSFHYSMAGSKEDPDGRWEKPHMSFPVEMSMDRVVVTKPGDTPPTLGGPIHENPESIKHRRKGGLVDWNLEDTYTLALWTAYVDFLDWKVINLPGIRPFELSKVIGPQPILLTLYLIPKERAAEKHYRRDITSVVELELCNTTAGLLGHAAKQWVAYNKHEAGMLRTCSEDSTNLLDQSDEEEEEEEDDEERSDDEEEENEEDDVERPLNVSSSNLMEDETEYDATDAATAAELGEGMYLRSEDKVVLREAGVENDDNATPCFVTNGAGFAVLQEGISSNSSIIIQKARKNRHASKARNELIKSGDTVSIKLIVKGNTIKESEVRYLSIHRGWWLKWVSTPPTKNGFFTIMTHETEFSDHDHNDIRASETQSAYLTFGGSFWLRHKRWKQYSVGVAAEGSATYGGRVLGLFQPRSGQYPSNDMELNPEDSDMPQTESDGKTSKKKWIRMLQLRAYEASQTGIASGLTIPKTISEEQAADEFSSPEKLKLVFSEEDSTLDVPAWIEVMNRTERIRQLTYAVRVIPKSTASIAIVRPDEESKDESPPKTESLKDFIRLRTGRDLAEIMRVGLSWRSTAALPPKKNKIPTPVSGQQSPLKESSDVYLTPTKGPPDSGESQNILPTGLPEITSMDESFNGVNEELNAYSDPRDEDFDSTNGDADSLDEEDVDESVGLEASDFAVTGLPVKKSKRRRVTGAIGKVATAGKKVAKAGAKAGVMGAKAGVKAGVGVTKAGIGVTKAGAAAGKKVVKTGVKLGKGTVTTSVSAGKAIIGSTSRSKNPPAREPKSKTSTKQWRKERELHVAVNQAVKRSVGSEQNLFFLAGELAAPEQSYRTVSNVLARMSSIPTSSPYSKKFNNILLAQIGQVSQQDTSFLHGGAIQLGVITDKAEANKGPVISEVVVARCLWESHWREEWCGIYKSSLDFYAPLTHKPCLELAFIDIQSVRFLDQHQRSPLPGFPILVLETAWCCHYLAFANEEIRKNFRARVQGALPKSSKGDDEVKNLGDRELWNARFWQGFQNSVESDSAVGRGKWAEVRSGSKKMISRTILNGRLMDFDLDQGYLVKAGGPGKLVEDLLGTALSFSLSSLEKDPERLVKFLDAVSYLKLLPVVEIDRSGVDAFCLFVNLYHCLLQHSLLLAVNGPLHRRTVGHFMRASCYEIGGDVFSLAELQSCIIRGNMSRPLSPRPPYVDVPKKSNAYRYYALDYTDPRVNFIVNTADVACPQDVPILKPENVEEQLSNAASIFLENQLTVDAIRRCVVLPKVCEVYKNDFENGDASGCLYYCSRYLDQASVNILKRMLKQEETLTIKYHSSSDQYHTKLVLRKNDGIEI